MHNPSDLPRQIELKLKPRLTYGTWLIRLDLAPIWFKAVAKISVGIKLLTRLSKSCVIYICVCVCVCGLYTHPLYVTTLQCIELATFRAQNSVHGVQCSVFRARLIVGQQLLK